MTFKKRFAKRVHVLILKLLGFEGVIWMTGTAALFLGCMDSATWTGLSIGVAGIKTWQKQKNIADELKGENYVGTGKRS